MKVDCLYYMLLLLYSILYIVAVRSSEDASRHRVIGVERSELQQKGKKKRKEEEENYG